MGPPRPRSRALALAIPLGLGAPAALAVLSAAPAALAQRGAQDDETRAAARQMARRGADAFDAGDYEKAYDLFNRAYELMPVPSISIFEARSAEKIGNLVEAMDAYERTARFEIDDGSPEPFVQAVDEGRRELEALRPRIPALTIAVEGRGHDDPKLEVRLDTKVVPPALVGVEGPANPGKHDLVATTPWGAHAAQTITLAEGEKKSVRLVLEGGNPEEAEKLAAPPGTAPGGPPPAAPRPGPEPARSVSSQRTLGLVALGVGGAGLVTGVVAGLLAVGKHSDAEKACPDRKCVEGTKGADDADAFRSLRTVSSIGYAVGAAGVIGGVTLLLTAPSEPAAESRARLTPFVGFGTAGVRGRF